MDRLGVVPGREKPCGRSESSSEEETELLECGLWNTLGRLLGTFSDPFGLTVLLILSGFFNPWEGIFFTSFKAFRSSAGSASGRGDGSFSLSDIVTTAGTAERGF